MTQLFSVSVRHVDGITVIEPEGYVDAESIEGLEESFQEACQAGSTRLLFNFSKTRKINSTGMSYILHLLQESINRGMQVRFSDLTRINQKLFSMIGIDEYGKIYTTEHEALLDY